MLTYQDLVAVGQSDGAKQAFCLTAIQKHKASSAYHVALDAEEYYSKRNVTISKYQKLLRTVSGRQMPDTFSANYKIRTAFFRRFVIQQTQYVLSNGVTFQNEATKERLGKTFDNRIQEAATMAMVDGVSFIFFNGDHCEVFTLADTNAHTGFVPLYDERTSQLMAGVRYWYSGESTRLTLHFTLYELDGYTEYVRVSDQPCEVVQDKRAYIVTTQTSKADGTEIIAYSNYDRFPIVPLWANDLKESELIGLREGIDAYDLIKSGLCNDIDDTSGFYWVIKNAGGMDDFDLAQFIQRMKTVKAAAVDGDEGATAEAHTLDIPVEARSKMLEILENDLYKDAQLLNVNTISATAKTATEIRAAYQPQDDKCAMFEYCITEAILGVLAIAGIDDIPSYQWNRIANQTEETAMIMSASNVLDDETILNHLPWITPEEVADIMKRKDTQDLERFNAFGADEQQEQPEKDDEI